MDLLLRRRMMMVAKNTVTFVDWISTDGNSYILTDIIPDAGQQFQISGYYPTYPSYSAQQYQVVFGNGKYYFLFGWQSEYSTRVQGSAHGVVRSSYGDGQSNRFFVADIQYKSSSDIGGNRFGNSHLPVDSSVIAFETSRTGTEGDVSQPIILFTRNSANGPVLGHGVTAEGQMVAGSKIYEFTIKRNNILEHDLKPARRNSDGVYGFYDTVSEKFYSGTNGVISGGNGFD